MSKYKKYLDNDNYPNGLRLVIILALALVIAVGVNMLAAFIPTKIGNMDFSAERVFSISKDTRDFLHTIDKPVTIYYVCEEGIENHNTEVMLNLYADEVSNIEIIQVDPVFEPEKISAYTKGSELTNNSLIVLSEDRRQIVNYTDYHSGNVFVLEDYLNSALKFVTGEDFKKAYSLTGHDESAIHASTIAYMGLDGFVCEEINLIEEKAVPSDCDTLIINGPARDITTEEANIILDYLSAGGSLFLATDYAPEGLPNLMTVTDYFGASLGGGLIMESATARYTENNPAYILPNIFSGDYTITRGINYILLPNAMPMVVEERADVEFNKLLETSETSYAMNANIFTGETSTDNGPFIISGSFKKPGANGDSKMVWSTSKYVTDVTVSQAVGGGNITYFLNSAIWLGFDNSVESLHAKTISQTQLVIPGSAVKAWGILIVVVIPLVAILLGAIIFIRRKRR